MGHADHTHRTLYGTNTSMGGGGGGAVGQKRKKTKKLGWEV